MVEGDDLKKLCFLLLLVSSLLVLSVPCSALYYTNDFPSYIPYNGVIYVEIQSSNLGKGSIVLPSSAKINTFCVNNDDSISNLTSQTVSGVFLYSNGRAAVNVRFPFLSTPQYQTSNTGLNQWQDFNITAIYNTNIEFQDYAGRGTQNDTFYLSNFEKIIFVLIVFDLIVTIFSLFFKVRRSFYD